MTVSDFEYKFRDNSHLSIGEGLISVHTKKCSKVINALDEIIIELTIDEYCVNAKNGFYLIANRKDNKFFIVNSKKEVINTIDSNRLSLLESSGYYVYSCEDSDSILVLDYSGRKIYDYLPESNYGFVDAHEISSSIVVFDFYTDFYDQDFNSCKFYKSVVINITTNQVLKHGTKEYDRDKTIICDASAFELPFEKKNENDFYSRATKEITTILLPVIKYTVVEPDYDEDGKVAYHKHIEFCDYRGNVILQTEYSTISNRIDGFYLIARQTQVDKDTVYGILDSAFKVFLPCQYPKLTIRNQQIIIEQPNWSNWQNFILDFQSKRFIAQKKNESKSFMLPFTYSGCSEGIDGLDNSNLLTSYRYNQEGMYCKGIINYDGDELLPAIYSNLYALTENLLEGYVFDKYRSSQLVSVVGNEVVLRNKYLKIDSDESHCRSGYFRVRVLDQNDIFKVRVGLIDDNGNEFLPPIYDYVFFPSEDKICYIKGGIPGWIDLHDDSIHEYPRCSLIRPFKMGIASFSKDKVVVKSLSSITTQTGYYDYDNDCACYDSYQIDDVCGELHIQFQKTDHKEGLIDITGNIVLDADYTEIVREYNLDNIIFVKSDYKWGVVSCSGEFIIPLQYKWYSTDSDNSPDDYENVVFFCGTDTEVDYYDKNAKLIGSEDVRTYNQRGYSQESEDNYDYDRDTYYALGGSDYDAFKERGGNIDDMMDGMGF